MHVSKWIYGVVWLLTSSPAPLSACIIRTSINFAHIEFADLVVTGSVKNYEIVLDPRARERRQALIEGLPDDVNPAARKILESGTSFLSDYARFEIVVDDVLRGEARDQITVVWDNSTFAEPDRLDGEKYLVALISAESPRPPLRGPSATIRPHPDGENFSVLQAPCASPFLFEANSPAANEVRIRLGAGSQ